MTNLEAKKFIKSAITYAINKDSWRDAEDFAQYYVERKIQNRECVIKYVFIDYLRQYDFKPRKEQYEKGTINTDVRNDPEFIRLEKSRCVGRQYLEDNILSSQIFKQLHGYERAVLILKIKYGFTFQEIENTFGLSQTRAFQLYESALEICRGIDEP